MQHVIQERQRAGYVRAAVFRLQMQSFAQDSQNVATPFARRQIKLDLIGEFMKKFKL